MCFLTDQRIKARGSPTPVVLPAVSALERVHRAFYHTGYWRQLVFDSGEA